MEEASAVVELAQLNPVVIGPILWFISLFFFVQYLFVAIAAARVSRTNPPFVLISIQCLADLWMLANYVWLSVEITFQTDSWLTHRMEFFLYAVGWFVENLMYIAVAINRTHFMLRPMDSKHTWTQGLCKTVVVCCILAAIFYDVACIFFTNAADDAYYGHRHQLFGFGPKDPLGSYALNFMLRAANFLTLSVALSAYLVVIVAALYGRYTGEVQNRAQKVKWYRAELRLTAISLLNFVPYTVYTVFHTVVQPSTGEYFFAKTLLGILNITTNSWLLLAFSSVTRKQLPFRKLKRKTSDIAAQTATEGHVRFRSMAPAVAIIVVKQRSRSFTMLPLPESGIHVSQ